MKFLFLWSMIMVFLSGIVVAINLSLLLPTNPNYHAEWWKVVFSCIVAIGFSISAKLYANKQ